MKVITISSNHLPGITSSKYLITDFSGITVIIIAKHVLALQNFCDDENDEPLEFRIFHWFSIEIKSCAIVETLTITDILTVNHSKYVCCCNIVYFVTDG